MLVFDIETGPQPEEKLRAILPPVELPPHPGEFTEDMVKYGNAKSDEKRKEKYDEYKAKHEASVAEYESTCRQKEEEHWAAFVDNAAKSATRGQVLAIGYLSLAANHKRIAANEDPSDDDAERALLQEFWNCFSEVGVGKKNKLVGHNIIGFDLPFLMQRSWMLQVPIPAGVLHGRYFNDVFVDTMQLWGCGAYRNYVSLNDLAIYFGMPGKNGNGAEFARLFKEDRKAAIAYLKQDLILTHSVAERLGVA